MSGRYSRQILFGPIGSEGQEKLKKSRIAIIGAGGLGSVIAVSLARAGAGFIRIADKDYLELSNLQRQILYNEDDLDRKIPKALIAKEKLSKINSGINIDAINVEVTDVNIGSIIKEIDIVLDGTDNFATRLIINKACVDRKIPWIFGSAAGSYGMVFNILPTITPCLQCVFPETPPEQFAQSSANAGILNSIVSVIGSIQSTEALKYLTGGRDSMLKDLLYIDLWDFSFEMISIKKSIDLKCSVCGIR